MIKLACPHCRMIGMVPELLSETGGWPIACHHCHQHYFAPVLSGPLPMARLIDLNCPKCGFVSQLDRKALEGLRIQKFTLFCPKCHESLPIRLPDVATNSSLPNSASKLKNNDISKNTQHSDAPKSTAIAKPAIQRYPFIKLGSITLLFVTGFLIGIFVIDAARNGVIERKWLDTILEALPHPSEVNEFMSSLTAKAVQLYR